MKESRLDRIEKGMEEFFRGMAELMKKAEEYKKALFLFEIF